MLGQQCTGWDNVIVRLRKGQDHRLELKIYMTSCLISAISAAGCGPSDMSCQCGPTQAAIGLGAAPCLLWSCSADELMQAQSAGSAQCSIYSVTRKGSDLPASNTGAVSSGFYKG